MGSIGSVSFPHFYFTDFDLRPGKASWSSTCDAVRQALEEYGFFLVTYNKLTPEIHDSTFSAVQELFDSVPTETKMKNIYEMPIKGYVGRVAKLPLHESLGIYNAVSLEDTRKFTETMWPDGNSCFCKTTHTYAKLVADLDQIVTRMIFESYGVEKYLLE